MHSVEDYMYTLEGNQQKIALFLHQKLTLEFELTAKIRYKIPFYYHKSWICYLNPVQKTAIELAFIRGNELSNSHALFDFKNRKQVMGLIIDNLEDLPISKIDETILEALVLDENVSYKLKGKR
jgi:hypothetical protein